MGGRLPCVQALWRGWAARRGAAGAFRRAKVAAATRLFPVGTAVKAVYLNSYWYQAVVDEIKGDGTLLISWGHGSPDDRVKTAAQLSRL